MGNMRALKRILSIHGHHAIFGLAVISLTLLIIWWTMFLLSSIRQQRSLYLENVGSALNYLAMKLGVNPEQPSVGTLFADNRFEILMQKPLKGRHIKSLAPRWPRYYLQVHESVLQDIDSTYSRKKFMVIGESSFFFLLILSSIYFVYQYVKTQKCSNRAMETFWTHVTHEIKTPISAVKAFLESVRNKSISKANLLPYVNMALQEVEKQEKFANNILAGSAMISNKYLDPLPLEKVSLVHFVHNYFKNHLLDLSKSRVELIMQTGERQHVQALCNKNGLKIILDNIVDNALKYGPDKLKLFIHVYSEKRNSVISIKDNGPGISPELNDKIFDAFRYLSGQILVRNHGAGMGLHISRNLARNMKGDIQVQTDEGHCGAWFKIHLLAGNNGI